MERKMATIRKIDGVKPIPDADSICAYQVGGWWVVDKVGSYKVGDEVIYCEVDSWIPHRLAPFLSKGKEPRVYEGSKGERLRTVRLRGQLSQGLLLPLTPELRLMAVMIDRELPFHGLEGVDLSGPLQIKKYEAPVPACLAGEVRGMFPGSIPKTDQERIQNLGDQLVEWLAKGYTWEVTEKLDGSSMTVYLENGEFGVCSRNLNLKPTQGNSLWAVAERNNFEAKLREIGRSLALQGELIGEGIQGNPYQAKGQEFYLFDIYDIDARRYFTPAERKEFVRYHGFRHVPVLESAAELDSIEEILVRAEGKSVMGQIGHEREGLVFKCNQTEASFKAISNRFLVKEK